MKPRRTFLSDVILSLPDGTEDNDLWAQWYPPEDGGPAIGSTWELTSEERQAIVDGANIEVLVFGVQHPPVSLRLSTYPLGKNSEVSE
jgi:hypothetical protein